MKKIALNLNDAKYGLDFKYLDTGLLTWPDVHNARDIQEVGYIKTQ